MLAGCINCATTRRNVLASIKQGKGKRMNTWQMQHERHLGHVIGYDEMDCGGREGKEQRYLQTYWVNFHVGEVESPSTIFVMGFSFFPRAVGDTWLCLV